MKKFSTITLGMVMLLTVSCSNDMIEVTDTATMNNGSNDIVAQMSHFNDSLSMTKPANSSSKCKFIVFCLKSILLGLKTPVFSLVCC